MQQTRLSSHGQYIMYFLVVDTLWQVCDLIPQNQTPSRLNTFQWIVWTVNFWVKMFIVYTIKEISHTQVVDVAITTSVRVNKWTSGWTHFKHLSLKQYAIRSCEIRTKKQFWVLLFLYLFHVLILLCFVLFSVEHNSQPIACLLVYTCKTGGNNRNIYTRSVLKIRHWNASGRHLAGTVQNEKKNIQQFFENVYIHKVLLPLTHIHILPAYQNKDKQS